MAAALPAATCLCGGHECRCLTSAAKIPAEELTPLAASIHNQITMRQLQRQQGAGGARCGHCCTRRACSAQVPEHDLHRHESLTVCGNLKRALPACPVASSLRPSRLNPASNKPPAWRLSAMLWQQLPRTHCTTPERRLLPVDVRVTSCGAQASPAAPAGWTASAWAPPPRRRPGRRGAAPSPVRRTPPTRPAERDSSAAPPPGGASQGGGEGSVPQLSALRTKV